jgi:hypothetical protein
MAKQPGENKIINAMFDNLRHMGYALRKDQDEFESNYHNSKTKNDDLNNKTNDSGNSNVIPEELKRTEDVMGTENNGGHTNECATKEYVQKEHKETTRLIVSVAWLMFGVATFIALLLTMGFNYFVSAKIEGLTNELHTQLGETSKKIGEQNADLKKLTEKVNDMSSSQAKIEGYIIAKQTK